MPAFNSMLSIKLLLIFVSVEMCVGQGVIHDILSDMSITRLSELLSNLWVQSISATLLVSAAPVLVIFAIPDLKNHNNLLKVLLAFAAGGLLGDAFLHLIPHSIDPHDHNSHDHGHESHGHSHDSHHGHSHDSHHGHSHDSHHGHSHAANHHDHHAPHDHTKNMIVGLWVVAGIMSFLCVEKFVRLVKSDHGHSHSIKSIKSTSDTDSVILARGESNNLDTEVRQRKSKEKKATKVKENKLIRDSQKEENIKVSGYLNLVADFAHNFTDGLAIGASFLVNKNVGIVTTITILFHELPHEIGDYAILVQSGCSRKKAILLQLVTAIGAMFGTVISLISQDAGSSSTWILPFTAGGFIYISTVSVIPELLQEHTKLSQTIKEILAMLVGVGMMIAIAYFE